MSFRCMDRKISDKEIKIKSSVSYLTRDPYSPMMCDKCLKYLGMWHMVRCALFKKKGSKYLVVCKKCNHINERIKGEMGKHIDERWGKYGV